MIGCSGYDTRCHDLEKLFKVVFTFNNEFTVISSNSLMKSVVCVKLWLDSLAFPLLI